MYVEVKVYDEKTGGTLPVTPSSSAAEVKLAEMNPQAERSRTASYWIEHFVFFCLVTQGRQTYFK